MRGKRDLGIDGRGEGVERVDPAGGEERREQIDRGAVALDQPCHAHGEVPAPGRGETRIPS